MFRSSVGIALLALAAPVYAQAPAAQKPEQTKPSLTVSVQAGRAEAVSRPDRTLVVYQATRKRDLVVTGERVVVEKGRTIRQTFSILAERVVAFLPPRGGIRGGGLPIQALYAQGFVRVQVEAPNRGRTVLEAAEVYLDFANERAFLRKAQVRFGGGKQSRGLKSAAFVLRAERLRVLGTARIVGEDASVSVCTHGKPHFALTCDHLELEADPLPPAPPISALGASGGLAGALLPSKTRRKNLFASLLRPKKQTKRRGSDALRAEGERPRLVDASGVAITVLPPWRSHDDPHRLPLLPFMTWGTDWPVPSVRVSSSSTFGTSVLVRLKRRLFRKTNTAIGDTTLTASGGVDYFEARGTAGDLGLEWKRKTDAGKGEGYLRAYGLRDRGDENRVGTLIRNEGRFWLRGLVREPLPGNLQVDGEVSRVSDEGFLLEYFRKTAQTEKEQETYLNVRGSWDDLGARLIGRWRLNDFQTQVERLPELRVDWIETPIATHDALGSLYFDAALRAGHLRFRPRNAGGRSSYDASRGDARFGLSYANRLGPVQLRGWAGARETGWSGSAADEEESIDRFAADGGWSVSTLLWKRFTTPFGIFRHELLPEIGTQHVFGVTREPASLLAFDEEVERVRPTDRVVLRLRTRLWTDSRRRHRKLVDFIVESAYLLRTQGDDVGRAWAPLRYDLRLNLLTWVSLRARAEHDVNRGALVDLNIDTQVIPTPGLVLGVNYRELNGPTRSRAVGWSASWRITKAWEVALDQQYDFATKEFIRHRGRLIRFFHRFALEFTVSNNPQQDDVSVSVSVSPVFSDRDPFAEDRDRDLYRP